jgi:hypothetical protein
VNAPPGEEQTVGLPDELMLLIFAHFDRREHGTLASVCKRWGRVMTHSEMRVVRRRPCVGDTVLISVGEVPWRCVFIGTILIVDEQDARLPFLVDRVGHDHDRSDSPSWHGLDQITNRRGW